MQDTMTFRTPREKYVQFILRSIALVIGCISFFILSFSFKEPIPKYKINHSYEMHGPFYIKDPDVLKARDAQRRQSIQILRNTGPRNWGTE
jgi:type IV secretory pathway VirD2 relaxase